MEFFKLTLDCIGTLSPFFSDNKCRICDCTTGGTFMWRDYHSTEYAVEGDVLYFKVEYPDSGIAFTPPRGLRAGDRSAIERVIEHCTGLGLPVRICAASETVMKGILELYPESTVHTDRAWSDYLYSSDDIINLPGRKYSGQRNHINRFIRENQTWSFEQITESNLVDIRAFFENYSKENIKESQAYDEGNRKTLEVLDNLELYGQFGGVLYADDRIVGASLGEIVNDTLFVHVEKADTSYQGSYPMLVNQFAKRFATEGIAYINREEDDGVEGLRTSKLSYHPITLLDKYLIELR